MPARSGGGGGGPADHRGRNPALGLADPGAQLHRLPRLHAALGTRRTVVQVDPDIARYEGINLRQAPALEPVKNVRITEHGLRYMVDFAEGHKTGFFCDQRENRKKLAAMAEGRSVLDLCCYTGGFSLAAKVTGGASDVTGVDLDEKAIAQARAAAHRALQGRRVGPRHIVAAGQQAGLPGGARRIGCGRPSGSAPRREKDSSTRTS